MKSRQGWPIRPHFFFDALRFRDGVFFGEDVFFRVAFFLPGFGHPFCI
jgi:hypothetical protein